MRQIRDAFFSFIRRQLSDGPCRYSKGCPLYNEAAYTCNSDDEASGGNHGQPYCGKFKMIERCKHKRCIAKITGYDTVAMICKECGYHVASGIIHQSPKKKLSFKDPDKLQ
jgi:hypothetical protein